MKSGQILLLWNAEQGRWYHLKVIDTFRSHHLIMFSAASFSTVSLQFLYYSKTRIYRQIARKNCTVPEISGGAHIIEFPKRKIA